MAKKEGSIGGLLPILGLIIIGIIIILVSNIFNFPLLITYGPSQYVSNIWQGHSDFYGKTKSNFKIYEKILPVSELQTTEPKAILRAGKRFKFKGYIQKDAVTWIAAKVFKNSEVVYGYFVVPEKTGDSTFWTSVPFTNKDRINNKYFMEVTDKQFKAYWDKTENKFIDKIFAKVRIKKASGGLNVQKIKESQTSKIIPLISTDKNAYYCTNQDYEIVEALYDRYLGDNFETHYLQTNKNYDLHSAELFKESTIIKTVSKWYFKVGFPIFLLILLRSIGGGSRGYSPVRAKPRCPECRSKDFDETERNIISERYKHEKKNGERDLRHKFNPLIRTWKLSFLCNKCSHSWQGEETELADEDKSPNLKIAEKKSKKPPTQKLQRETEKQTNPGSVSQNDTQNIPDNKPGNNSSYEGSASKKLIIKGDMTINQFKDTLKKLSNFTIRIYSGKKFADGDATLFSVGYKQPNPIKLKLNDRMTVDNFEKAFKDKLGISIQVENQQGKLADNSLVLNKL